MNSERIVIDGQDLDLYKDNVLHFELESNILKKVEELSCCWSYTHQVPNSLHNRTIFGDLLTIGRKGGKFRKYVDAQYYRDGLLIFSGNCYVDRVDPNNIEISFRFGINRALQQIKDDGLKLDELYNDSTGVSGNFVPSYTDEELEELKLKLPLNSVEQMAQFPFNYTKPVEVFYNDYKTNGDTIDREHVVPSVNVKAIYDLLKVKYGIEIDSKTNSTNYWIMTPHKRRLDKFAVKMRSVVNFDGMSSTSPRLHLGAFDEDYMQSIGTNTKALDQDDISGRARKEIDTTSGGKSFYYFANVKRPFKINAVLFNVGGFNQDVQVRYYSKWDYKRHTVNIYHPIQTLSAGESYMGWFYPEKMGVENEYEAGHGPVIGLHTGNNTNLTSSNFEIIFFCQLAEEDTNKGWLSAMDCLPNVGIQQFINDVCFGVFGEFPVNQMETSNTLKFYSLEDIIEREPYDWSDKLMADELTIYKGLEGLSQTNRFVYAKGDHEPEMQVEVKTPDPSLDAKGDWFESDLGYYLRPNYPIWDGSSYMKPSSKIVSVERFMYAHEDDYPYNFAVQKNENLEWMQEGDISGDTLRKIFKEPVRLECKLKLSSLDISTLDMARPVYLRQMGAVFFIQKLSVGDEVTEATLVKIL